MIHPRQLSEFVFREPFQPFRLHMASGRTFEVRHPEMIDIGKSSIKVYHPFDPNLPNREASEQVSLMLLESIEPIDAKRPAERSS
jgi:hypothetical protein